MRLSHLSRHSRESGNPGRPCAKDLDPRLRGDDDKSERQYPLITAPRQDRSGYPGPRPEGTTNADQDPGSRFAWPGNGKSEAVGSVSLTYGANP